ncbi:multiple sugar transport system substrate-binding protein [Pseudoduganella lurida]|uniref:Multiple sugar transport system substrate-binding protein n=1 Tax=Pseudoduganella lurida TaxID=1036180 RepID=A0A562RE59_9BURK|nr:extracellular solute-binding protein [Pseudoduganella lurida]TWI67318.1 multiple sugar transport system substrate-binding protein [Pseudoduganella lurida]
MALAVMALRAPVLALARIFAAGGVLAVGRVFAVARIFAVARVLAVRRVLALGWALAFAGMLVLPARAGGGAPANVQVVRMWTLLSGGDGARMRALVDGFNASQREVRVESTTLKWGEPFYTKLITAGVVGEGPDVATIHLSRLPNLAGGGVLRPITPAELDAAGLAGTDFLPRQWDRSQYGNGTYAIPLDIHPLVLYYNKTLVGQAGLLDGQGRLKPIVGMAALTAAFRAVKERTGKDGLAMEAAQSTYAIWRLWLSLLAQQGLQVVDKNRFAYGPAGEHTLAAIAHWFQAGYATPGLNYPASTSQFMAGNAGFMLNGAWEVPELVRGTRDGTLGFRYGIVPLPALYGNASAWADSHGFAVPANTGRPLTPARMQAVLRFVAYVSRHSLGWAEGGHIPAYRPVAESAALRTLMPNAEYAGAAPNVVYDPPGWYMGAAGPVEAIASKFLPAPLSGQLTPADALRRFETEAQRLVDKRPPQY